VCVCVGMDCEGQQGRARAVSLSLGQCSRPSGSLTGTREIGWSHGNQTPQTGGNISKQERKGPRKKVNVPVDVAKSHQRVDDSGGL